MLISYNLIESKRIYCHKYPLRLLHVHVVEVTCSHFLIYMQIMETMTEYVVSTYRFFPLSQAICRVPQSEI